MKKFVLIAGIAAFSLSTTAQELPQPSPSSKMEQKVGLTDISLDYSRPGVKGRKVFGELVKYNEIWRFGANSSTKITLSNAISFGKTNVPAGTYSLYVTPSEKGMWKLHFNSKLEAWGEGDYDKANDVAVVEGKMTQNSFTETLLIDINNITASKAHLSLKWENVRVDWEFTMDTEKMAEANIKAAIEKGEDLDKVYNRAASYHLNAKNTDEALALVEKGLKVKETHNLLFQKAKILKEKGDMKGAIATAEKAHAKALEAKSQGWADYIKSNIDEWKK